MPNKEPPRVNLNRELLFTSSKKCIQTQSAKQDDADSLSEQKMSKIFLRKSELSKTLATKKIILSYNNHVTMAPTASI